MRKPKAAKYSLWTMPYSEWKSPLADLKINPNIKIDPKKTKRNLARIQKQLERDYPWLFKKRRMSDLEWAAMMLRPLCDHD